MHAMDLESCDWAYPNKLCRLAWAACRRYLSDFLARVDGNKRTKLTNIRVSGASDINSLTVTYTLY